MHPYYITTPIYYVNDRPHIGHCYSTLVADAAARFQRLSSGDPASVFLLTGTDEHADKVVVSAAAHGVSPQEWSDRNAAEFEKAFAFIQSTHDDFIRTTQERHKAKVLEYVRELKAKGAIYLGDYSGWWDSSQEEYLTESVAKESPKGAYTSPVTGKPLVMRTEKNYFFKLSAFEKQLRAHIDANPGFIQPESRRNEVLGRLRQGLQDVPVSRAVTGDPASQWGIRMPDDAGHRIYVWIDALFNYLSAVDTDERRKFWPPAVHVLAKDILWFHAVIWPAMLMALGRELPGVIYAHSYWVRDGAKMSKSLGNFVTIEVMQAYAAKFGLDALRWYLLTQGPLGNADADFGHGKFVEVYNADLANGFGNCASRVGNMVDKYFEGKLPEGAKGAHAGTDFAAVCGGATSSAIDGMKKAFDVGGMLSQGITIVRAVDQYINTTAPFKLAKTVDANPAARAELGAILYNCAEALRIASLLLSPALVIKIPEFWKAWGCAPSVGVTLKELAEFGGKYALQPGQGVGKGEILYMRADVKDAPPA